MSWKELTINVVTWNCAGNTPPATFDITNILTFDKDPSFQPDLVLVGF